MKVRIFLLSFLILLFLVPSAKSIFYNVEIVGLDEVRLDEYGKYYIYTSIYGTLVNSNLTITLLKPNGETISLPYSKISEGIFETIIIFNMQGMYVLKVVGQYYNETSEDRLIIACRDEVKKEDLLFLNQTLTLKIQALMNDLSLLKNELIKINRTYVNKIENIENEMKNLISQINHNVTNKIGIVEARLNDEINKINSSLVNEINYLKNLNAYQYKSLYSEMNRTSSKMNETLKSSLDRMEGGFNAFQNNIVEQLATFRESLLNNLMIFTTFIIAVYIISLVTLFLINKSSLKRILSVLRSSHPSTPPSIPQHPSTPPPSEYLPPPPIPREFQPKTNEAIKNTKIKIKDGGEKMEWNEKMEREDRDRLLVQALDDFKKYSIEFEKKKNEVKDLLGKELKIRYEEVKALAKAYDSIEKFFRSEEK